MNKNKKQVKGKHKPSKQIVSKRGKSYKNLYWLLGILVVTLIAYFPAFNNDFTNWDDEWYVTENLLIQQLNAHNINDIFFKFFHGQYSPLTMLSLAITFHFAEFAPWLYHFVSIIVHLINVALVFWFIKLLFNNLNIAVIAAVLFGVNTIHVESVAWISAQKIPYYGMFLLLSLISYFMYVRNNKWIYYILSLILFVLTFLSKEQAVFLSMSIVAIDYLLKRKLLSTRVILEKIPFFILSLIFGVVTLYASQSDAGIYTFHKHLFYERVIYASYALVQYPFKLLAPFNLSAIYPYPVKVGGSIALYYWLYIIPVIGMIAGFVYSLKRSRLVAFAIMFFVFNIFLSLILQVIAVRYVIIADRYAYVSSIGLFLLIGHGYETIVKKKHTLKLALQIMLVAYTVMLIILTYNRCQVWKNSEVLWTDVISKQPNADLAYKGRGNYYARQSKEYKKALTDFEHYIRINPKDAKIYSNIGNVQGLMKRFDLALKAYSQALSLDSNNVETHINLGVTYIEMKQYDKALKYLEKAMKLEKSGDKLSIYKNRAFAYLQTGRYQQAIDDYNYVLSKDIYHGKSYENRGIAYYNSGRQQEAVNDFTKAIELTPDEANLYYERSVAYKSLDNFANAMQDALKAQSMGLQISNNYMEELKKNKR